MDRLFVLGVCQEGDIALAGILNAGDAVNLNLPVAVQPAIDPLRQFAQFHLTRL